MVCCKGSARTIQLQSSSEFIGSYAEVSIMPGSSVPTEASTGLDGAYEDNVVSRVRYHSPFLSGLVASSRHLARAPAWAACLATLAKFSLGFTMGISFL